MGDKRISQPIDLKRIRVTDNFWKNEMELVRKEVIPYQWEALNDRVPGANPSFCMRNYRVAGKINRLRREQGADYEEKIWPVGFGGGAPEVLPESMDQMEDRFYGFVFQDSDFAKWIEAVGYSLTQHPDEKLEAVADAAIDIVCDAQQDDGYLNTFYIINDRSKIFSNLKDNHELYCFGHLTEGAVAYYQATGKDKLLKAAERYADYINNYFGSEEGKCKGYPGHEIAEMALVRLYEVTGNQKYLDLSRFFTDMRGTRPYYFDYEHGVKQDDGLRYQYHQAHLPVRDQKEAVGHAVRAVYLYSGMADLARLTGDEKLRSACETLWEDIVNHKMYITGGIGATHIGEAFSFAYDLPNDTAYAETCASIGLVFFARRMLQLRPDAKYANVMERALYNGILSGMALDGKSFFYVNPLESLPKACHNDERKFHVKPVRQKWFGCACCPPNIARTVSSIGSYAYGETEDTMFIHLYVGGEVTKKIGDTDAVISIHSGFPWDGKVSVQVNTESTEELTLAFRLPDWCEDYTAEGLEGAKTEVKDGYLYVTRAWNGSEAVTLDFPMQVRIIQANPAVREDIGKAALMRGPVVYCIEEADNGSNLHLTALGYDPQITEERTGEFGQNAVTLLVSGKYRREDAEDQKLYHTYRRPQYGDKKLRFIPYYTWANRGEGEMQVWVREQ